MPPPSRSPAFATALQTMHRCGMTCVPSTARRGVGSWIASLEATRASRSVSRAVEKGRTIPDTSGPISGESSKKCNPDAASLKTWQTIFGSDLNQYGETLAIWTTRLRRESLRRQKLGRHIHDSGFSSWPTPMAADDGKKVTTSSLQAGLIGRASGFYGPLIPTIAQDGRTLYTSSRALNPRFVEWLMGFPIGWTALQPLETASYQQWQQQHGAR
jgi:hypothetical protein